MDNIELEDPKVIKIIDKLFYHYSEMTINYCTFHKVLSQCYHLGLKNISSKENEPVSKQLYKILYQRLQEFHNNKITFTDKEIIEKLEIQNSDLEEKIENLKSSKWYKIGIFFKFI